MALLVIYPSSVTQNTSTWTNPNNVVGNDASISATITGSVAVGQTNSMRLAFSDLSLIPSGAVINNIRCCVVAKVSVASTRDFYSANFSYQGGSPQTLTTATSPTKPISTAFTYQEIVITRAQLQSAGITDAMVRDGTNTVDFTFLSQSTTSTTTTWNRAWIVVDYTMPGETSLILYPTTLVTSTQLTNATNLVGNTTSEATDTARTATANTIVNIARFYFDTPSIPAGSVISSITFVTELRAGTENARRMNSGDIFKNAVGSYAFFDWNVVLPVANNIVAIRHVTKAQLTGGGWTDAELREANIEFTMDVYASSTASSTLAWQKAYIIVDYAAAAPSGNNALFFGENF